MKASYVSPLKTFSAGGVATIKPWIPEVGKSGRRNVIDSIVCEITYAWTPATANLLGENIPNILANIIVDDAGGQRRNLPGRALRLANTKQLNHQAYVELADLASGAERTGTLRLDIPFTIEHAKEGKEFAIPAELLRDIQITWCGAAGLDYGSSTVTIGTTTMVLRAYCHEEDYVELKARDIIKSELMNTTTQSQHEVNGRLDYVIAYKDGDELADMSGFTASIMKPFQLLSETAAQKLHEYREDHPGSAVAAQNPFTLATPKAAIAHSTRGQNPKIMDHPLVKTFTLDATNTVASAHLLMRAILPRNKAVDRAVMKKHGKTQVVGGPLSRNNNAFLARRVR